MKLDPDHWRSRAQWWCGEWWGNPHGTVPQVPHLPSCPIIQFPSPKPPVLGLTTPGVAASIDVWRVARMKTSEGQARPLRALATALFAEGALPELTEGNFTNAAALAGNFDRGGEVMTQPISVHGSSIQFNFLARR